MHQPSVRDLAQLAREAGYVVDGVEQLRANRWLLTLRDEAGAVTLALIQARPMVSAADVQDLAELVRLRRPHHGILVAYGGSFTPTAQRTLAELNDSRLRLYTAAAHAADLGGEVRQGRLALQPFA